MDSFLSRGLGLWLVLFGFLCVPIFAQAGDSPILGGGNFGLGLELGDPGAWGALEKIWIDKTNAFQPAVKIGDGLTLLQLDYLWSDYDVIHPDHGLMPLYFGVGGDLDLQNSVAVGARGVVGISYLFNRREVPVDILCPIGLLSTVS